MRTVLTPAGLALALTMGAAAFMLAPTMTDAQQASSKKKTAIVKAGKNEKVCRVTLKYTGEKRTWVCPKNVKCCVWHEINYTKCGTTWGGCF